MIGKTNNGSINHEPASRRIILSAVFIALAITGGLLFIPVPNVELITVMIFLAGLTLGIKNGAVVGGVAELLYSLFNPLGAALPPIMIAQVLSMTIVGATGGLTRNYLNLNSFSLKLILSGVLGFFLTLLFDAATTYAYGLTIGQTLWGTLTAITVGLPFYITHLLTNTLIFSLFIPILARLLSTLNVYRNPV